jgi:hypothetical protein
MRSAWPWNGVTMVHGMAPALRALILSTSSCYAELKSVAGTQADPPDPEPSCPVKARSSRPSQPAKLSKHYSWRAGTINTAP